MKNKNKSIVKLTGSKTAGWIIEISEDKLFHWDMALTNEEAILLRDLLNKKILGDKTPCNPKKVYTK